MTRLYSIAAILVVLAAATIAHAADTDAVEKALDASRAAHKASLVAAKDSLVGAFDSKIKETAQTGNLDQVKSLIAEKKSFEEMTALPTSQTMKAGTTIYIQAIKKANDMMATALDKAVRQYTQALEVEKAAEIQAELKKFQAEAQVANVQGRGMASIPARRFEYTLYEWKAGQQPIKMISKEEGFCYLTKIHGALDGGGEWATITLEKDGFWYLSGGTARGFLTVQAIAVKIKF